MTYEFKVVELPRQPTLVTTFTALPETLGEQFLHHLPRVLDVAIDQRCKLAGAPFVRYLGSQGDDMVVEIGLILRDDPQGEGDIAANALPAGPAVTTIHVGPYETLGTAHAELRQWAQQTGRMPASPLFELYVSDPADGDDPAGWRTEVYLPLSD